MKRITVCLFVFVMFISLFQTPNVSGFAENSITVQTILELERALESTAIEITIAGDITIDRNLYIRTNVRICGKENTKPTLTASPGYPHFWIDDYRKVTFENVIFDGGGNHPQNTRTGGVICHMNTEKQELKFENCEFRNNRSSLDGSIVAVADHQKSGGAVSAPHGKVVLSNCIFENNISGWYGGGVFAYEGMLNDCSFIQNGAGSKGGGAYISYAIVNECRFFDNFAQSAGGGLDVHQATIENCQFTKNQTMSEAYPGDYGYGGGVYSSDNVTIKNSSFDHNYATSRGGGACVYSATLQNCTFVSNVAAGLGGGIYGGKMENVLGSVIWHTDDNLGLLFISGCTIAGNRAEGYKGIPYSYIFGDGSDTSPTGGGFFTVDTPRLMDNIISGNIGSEGMPSEAVANANEVNTKDSVTCTKAVLIEGDGNRTTKYGGSNLIGVPPGGTLADIFEVNDNGEPVLQNSGKYAQSTRRRGEPRGAANDGLAETGNTNSPVKEPRIATKEQWDYELIDGGAMVTQCGRGYGTKPSGDIVIPSELGGYAVVRLGNSLFNDFSGITSVDIPDSVTSIGRSVFHSCFRMIRVNIPDGVTVIGDKAFYGCSALIDVTIPINITTIGDWTFFGCSGLTSLLIPDGVESIGEAAFRDCSGLTSLTIPDSVTSIGKDAFAYCRGLNTVIIPDNVTSIGDGAFAGCPNLILTITKGSVAEGYAKEEKIRFSYLNGEDADKSAGVGAQWKYILNDDYAMITGYLEEEPRGDMMIPSEIDGYIVTEIDSLSFYQCSNLTSVTIPNSITNIGFRTFQGCYNITSATLPNSLTSIENAVFASCSALTNITIPDSVTSIGVYAFEHCKKLTSIIIPDGVTSIGDGAFNGCGKLTSVTIPASVTSIGTSVFANCPNLTLTLTQGSVGEQYAKKNGIPFIYHDDISISE